MCNLQTCHRHVMTVKPEKPGARSLRLSSNESIPPMDTDGSRSPLADPNGHTMTSALIRCLTTLILAALVIGVIPSASSAQYFGRNKVRYRDFDFKVLRTDHFDVYYYEEEREAAELAARMAERWYARISQVLD